MCHHCPRRTLRPRGSSKKLELVAPESPRAALHSSLCLAVRKRRRSQALALEATAAAGTAVSRRRSQYSCPFLLPACKRGERACSFASVNPYCPCELHLRARRSYALLKKEFVLLDGGRSSSCGARSRLPIRAMDNNSNGYGVILYCPRDGYLRNLLFWFRFLLLIIPFLP